MTLSATGITTHPIYQTKKSSETFYSKQTMASPLNNAQILQLPAFHTALSQAKEYVKGEVKVRWPNPSDGEMVGKGFNTYVPDLDRNGEIIGIRLENTKILKKDDVIIGNNKGEAFFGGTVNEYAMSEEKFRSLYEVDKTDDLNNAKKIYSSQGKPVRLVLITEELFKELGGNLENEMGEIIAPWSSAAYVEKQSFKLGDYLVVAKNGNKEEIYVLSAWHKEHTYQQA